MTKTGRQANLEAIARRLGVRQKSLLSMMKNHAIEPLDQASNLYDLDEVLGMLYDLSDKEQAHLRAIQRSTPETTDLYRDKFADLAAFAPQAKMSFHKPSNRYEVAAAVPAELPEHMSTLEVAELLHISIPHAKDLTRQARLAYRTKRGSGQKLWNGHDLNIALRDNRLRSQVERWQADAKVEQPQKLTTQPIPVIREPKRATAVDHIADIAARVQVEIRARDTKPQIAHLYVGPTNSGKTYTALQNLFAAYEANPAGLHVYAGPLRMLAYEVYQKMVERYGAENVGFLTGEEQLNPEARLIACTVEMAPATGNTLVLDETHWIADHARGQHWTNLLLGATYNAYHVLTAAEALPMVSQLIDDAEEIITETFERKTPLVFIGGLKISQVPARSAVICFSRKSVYATANLLEKAGKKVGVLYGALPLNVRKKQIDRYLSGQYDIMVTTDVIGHGINLPIDNVIFAQSEKFDGIEQRALRTWEIAQIAGRAGRYGLSKEGRVYHLTGRAWFTKDASLLREGTMAGAGQIPTDLRIDEAVVTPLLRDLRITKPEEILLALEAWQAKAKQLLAERNIAPSNLLDKIAILQAVAEPRALPMLPKNDHSMWPVSLPEVWQLISGPYNPENKTLQKIFTWLAEPNRATSNTLDVHLQDLLRPLRGPVHGTGNHNADQVAILEQAVSGVGEMKMANIMFGQLGTLYGSELLEAEDRLNEAITNTLHSLIQAGKYGVCKTCGAPTAPWFAYCEDCFHQQSFSFAF